MPIKPITAQDRLIVALDVNTTTAARSLFASLREVVGMFKIGSQLFTTAGPDLVKEIVDTGARVFLDLKFHDIPHQVAGSARAATELGVSMFTLHASGGSEMMRRAVDAVGESAAKKNIQRPAVLAVSILTSIDIAILSQIGVEGTAAEAVLRLVNLASNAGVDGVVASPLETEAIRKHNLSRDLLVVTPGIRPQVNEGSNAVDDQKRVATPAAALAAGSDYLVIGRPITSARDPVVAAQLILTEIQQAIGRNQGELSRSGSV